MRHGSLFSGIGGFDLAASWMGWNNIFHCEKDPFCRSVLQFYWPEAESYDDIYRFNSTKFRGTIDILSGGFPCQPFSFAGKRKGTNDDRYLWPQALRVIKEVRPNWVVLENVAGLFTILEQQSLSTMELKEIQLFCENDSKNESSTIIRIQRRVIGTIIAELRSARYLLPTLNDGTPILLCIPACAVNAPHRRDRVWIVAYAECGASEQNQPKFGKQKENTIFGETNFHQGRYFETLLGARAFTHTRRDGSYSIHQEDEIQPGQERQQTFSDLRPVPDYFVRRHAKNDVSRSFAVPGWDRWPSQSPFYGRNDGFPGELDSITLSKWEEQSMKGFGNAIVPQVAYELFKKIDLLSAHFTNFK